MPYKTTDKVVAYLVKRYTKIFRKAKGLTSFDELNVIGLSHEIYDEALEITKTETARLADVVYKKHHAAEEPQLPGIGWVLGLMAAYNPVTKYIYEKEVDRKRAKFAESVIASETKAAEIDAAFRSWVAMNKQFADDVTFDTIVKAYKDSGVEYVRWVTHPDDRRCKECKSRHGKVYHIDKVPAKPHRNCRCYVEKEH